MFEFNSYSEDLCFTHRINSSKTDIFLLFLTHLQLNIKKIKNLLWLLCFFPTFDTLKSN